MKQGQTCLYNGQFGTIAYLVGKDSAIVVLDDDRRVNVPVNRLVFLSSEDALKRAEGLAFAPPCPQVHKGAVAGESGWRCGSCGALLYPAERGTIRKARRRYV